MKNNLIALCVICAFVMMPYASALVFQHGSSRDLVQGYDRGWIWHHAYLKNDHTTAYCFDNPDFADILKDAQKNNREVIITYETYFFRGFFCWTGEKFDNVIITKIEYADTTLP